MGEVIKFTGNQEKVGFYELDKIQLNISNALATNVDMNRKLNSPEVMREVKSEINQVAEDILFAIEKIDGVRPEMPDETEFKELARSLLTIPLAFGQSQAAISYYGIDEHVEALTNVYHQKRKELKDNVLRGL